MTEFLQTNKKETKLEERRRLTKAISMLLRPHSRRNTKIIDKECWKINKQSLFRRCSEEEPIHWAKQSHNASET